MKGPGFIQRSSRYYIQSFINPRVTRYIVNNTIARYFSVWRDSQQVNGPQLFYKYGESLYTRVKTPPESCVNRELRLTRHAS